MGGYRGGAQGPSTLDYLEEDLGGDDTPDEQPGPSGFVGSTRGRSRRESSRGAAGQYGLGVPEENTLLGDEGDFPGEGGYGEDDLQYFDDFEDGHEHQQWGRGGGGPRFPAAA